jgi:hypothetical protein
MLSYSILIVGPQFNVSKALMGCEYLEDFLLMHCAVNKVLGLVAKYEYKLLLINEEVPIHVNFVLAFLE